MAGIMLFLQITQKTWQKFDFNYRLWEDGWKDRYYKSKFDVDKDDIEFRHNVVSSSLLSKFDVGWNISCSLILPNIFLLFIWFMYWKKPNLSIVKIVWGFFSDSKWTEKLYECGVFVNETTTTFVCYDRLWWKIEILMW